MCYNRNVEWVTGEALLQHRRNFEGGDFEGKGFYSDPGWAFSNRYHFCSRWNKIF